MATTTTNNGWDIPESSDYVKDGATAIADLGQQIDTSVGDGLKPWTTWAPLLAGGWLNGNGVWTARYAHLGDIVHVAAQFVVGSTTTKGTIMSINLPVAAHASAQIGFIANATVAGSSLQLLFGTNTSSTVIAMRAMLANGTYLTTGNVTATVPATWATNDVVTMNFTYQAA